MQDNKEHAGLPVPDYKPQSDHAIGIVTAMKHMEENVLRAFDALVVDLSVDKRWLAIGRTAIEQGFMAVNRSVFKPDRVKLPSDTVMHKGVPDGERTSGETELTKQPPASNPGKW